MEEQAQAQEQPIEQLQEQPMEQSQEEKKSNSGSAFYKQKIEQMELERQQLKQKLEEIQTQQLHEKENFKELWELEKQKREEAENKTKNLSETVFNNFRSSAIREQALAAGILKTAVDDLDLVDASLVQVETTDQGRINVHGAKEFVEALKEAKPHWFKNLNTPTINTGLPTDTSTSHNISASELIQLQKKDPAKYKELMKKRLSIA